jgi:membrane protease YdiL (CAAX protease family)
MAILITAFLFALLHGPASLAQWVWFTATGVAYGSIRVASGSTSAAAIMHAAYNLTLILTVT